MARFDACFLDVNLGAENGLDLLAKLLAASPTLPVVMVTAYANISTAVEAMRRIKTALDPLGIINPGKILPAANET